MAGKAGSHWVLRVRARGPQVAATQWAGDHHDVVVVDRKGRIVEDFRFDDTAQGWKFFIDKLSLDRHSRLALESSHSSVRTQSCPHAVGTKPAVAIETSSGATVERLLEAGYAVYPVNPLAGKRYRERKAPSGTKTDRFDAWSLADVLDTQSNVPRVKDGWRDRLGGR